MSANLWATGDAQMSVHSVTNMTLHPEREASDGNGGTQRIRTLIIETVEGTCRLNLHAATDGSLTIAELI